MEKNRTLEISYSLIEKDGTTTKDSKKFGRVAHNDLVARFENLRPHYGLLSDWLSTQQIKSITDYKKEQVDAFHVSAVSIGGAEGEEGIQLTGYKKNKRGKALNFTTPFERKEEVEESRYRNMDDLLIKIDDLFAEVHLYMGGKGAPDPQLGLPFGDAGDDDFKNGEEN